MNYTAPIQDMLFVLKYIAPYDQILSLDGNEEFDWEIVKMVLDKSGKLAGEVIDPLNRVGDVEGATLTDGAVKMPSGWQEAYDAVAHGGWIGLTGNSNYGGQALPNVVGAAVNEIWQSSNMAFSLCNLLTQGAIHAIELSATNNLKETYLPKMMDGTWSGTMNLTEPQAGTDLSAIRTIAKPKNDHYLIYGQKIFVSYGDHELTENIIHLVLARTPDAPGGVKGLSLFIVPKFLVNEDGTLGERNDCICLSLEDKLGIHGSPTATLIYGENGGATGYLVGAENQGLKYMFIMMNRARYNVGIQGLAVAERAYQKAREYAKERVQGRVIGRHETSAIVGHPGVSRLLLSMKSRIEAMRCLAIFAAGCQDRSLKETSNMDRETNALLFDFLTPIVKGWSTEMGQDIASVALQVQGGLGYIEETGAAQYLRDARITTIYEGTTAIQANDLIFRKTLKDDGKVARSLLQDMRGISSLIYEVDGWGDRINPCLLNAVEAVENLLEWILKNYGNNSAAVAAAADGYLQSMGFLLGGGLLLKSAAIANNEGIEFRIDRGFAKQKVETASFFATYFFPYIDAISAASQGSSITVTNFEDDWF